MPGEISRSYDGPSEDPMDSVHTPGPWRVGSDGDWIAGAPPFAARIATVDQTEDEAEWRANARLIAKAPEMARVLRESLEVLGGVDTGDAEVMAAEIESLLREVSA